MRRGAAWAMALALAIGATAGCGGDDGAAGTPSTTSEPAAAVDLTTRVDEFCAKTDEINAIFQESVPAGGDAMGPAPEQQQIAPEQEERLQTLFSEVAQMSMGLQGATAQMLPGDAARYRECAAVIGGGVDVVPG